MKRILTHLRRQIFRGAIAIIPAGLSVVAVRFLYREVDQRIAKPFDEIIGRHIPGLGFLIVLIVLYLLGLLASNFAGRQLLRVIEKISDYLPIVRTTYRVGKEVGSVLSLQDRQAFKRVVLIETFRSGVWTIGFVTGSLVDPDDPGTMILKVFVPTPPNPASGAVIFVRESETRDPGWSVEEALRTVVSGGMIGPHSVHMPGGA